MDSQKLREYAYIFDFDGTMCRLFSNYDLTKTAELLHIEMDTYGILFDSSCDTFDVFDTIVAQTKDGDLVRTKAFFAANSILTQAECDAVSTGEIVPGVNAVLPFLVSNGYKVGIATNNSAECVEKFMDIYMPNIDIPIIGRVGQSPELMKPNPWSVNTVSEELGVPTEKVIFIGDTKRDFDCSKNVNCHFIGMAPTKIKQEKLLRILPEKEIVRDFYELLNCIGINYVT